MDYTRQLGLSSEELANSITHGLGVLLCLVGIPFLLTMGAQEGDSFRLLGLGVFSVSLLLVYLSSTIYHSLSRPAWKDLFHRIDHISIYFLIAGTHTPFMIYFLQQGSGLFYLFLIWGMALLGVLYKIFFFGRLQIFSLLLYLAMGWLAVLTLPPMVDHFPAGTLSWILAGGIAYTLGVVFFVWKKLPYHHAIWHIFVLAGSASHFIAMLYLVQG